METYEKALERKEKGNELYRMEELEDSGLAYTEAIDLLEAETSIDSNIEGDSEMREQMKKLAAICYCNRAAIYLKTEEFELAKKDAADAIERDGEYLRARYRRACACEKLELYRDAMEDMQWLNEHAPGGYQDSMKMKDIFERKAQEKESSERDEMLGKLKEMGNSLLGNFGLSLDNFNLNQDPSTGGYNIQFQK